MVDHTDSVCGFLRGTLRAVQGKGAHFIDAPHLGRRGRGGEWQADDSCAAASQAAFDAAESGG